MTFQQELDKIMTEAEEIEIKDFTFELLNAIWSEFCDVDEEDIDPDMVLGYANETKESLEIFNPEFKIDIDLLKKTLILLENYLKSMKP